MVPVIGLPAVAPGAPAVEFTRDELAKIAEDCLVELEEKEPFRNYFVFVGDPEQMKHYYPILDHGWSTPTTTTGQLSQQAPQRAHQSTNEGISDKCFIGENL